MTTTRSERDAADAADEIRAALELWTSPQLGIASATTSAGSRTNMSLLLLRDSNRMNDDVDDDNVPTSSNTDGSSIRKSNRYHDSFDDLDAWDNNNDDDTYTDTDQFQDARSSTADNMHDDEQELLLFASSGLPGTSSSSSAQTKRTKTFHRAGTPVMSNNSQPTNRMNSSDYYYYYHNNHDADADPEPPYNVESPWIRAADTQYRSSNSSSRTTGYPTPVAAATMAPHTTQSTPRRTTGMNTLIRQNRNPPQPPPAEERRRPESVAWRMEGTYGSDFRPYYTAAERLWRWYNHTNTSRENTVVTASHQQQQRQQLTLSALAGNSTMMDDHDDDDDDDMDGTTGHKEVEEPYVRLQSDELKMELEFLMSLHRTCWTTSTTSTTKQDGGANGNYDCVKEGNFWLLLAMLRKLGIATLLWDDDTASKQQHRRTIQSHIQYISIQTDLTPAAILRTFYSNNSNGNSTTTKLEKVAPLPLQRRKELLLWLHQCFQNKLPSNIMRTIRTKIVWSRGNHNTKKQQETGLFMTDKDEEILQSCLSLLLAGRLSDAQELVRHCGLSWRAAMWGGGTPHGYSFTKEHPSATIPSNGSVPGTNELTVYQPQDLYSIGNPRRALWRRMMWKHAEQLIVAQNETTDRSNPYDVSMAALLSSNLKIALDCAPLRTWECGLYAVIRCTMDRLEDDVLHRHNQYRRSVQENGPLYPGTEHEDSEREQLQATSDVADIDEADAVRILDGTPFEEMRGDDLLTQCVASFLIGKTAILSFMKSTMDRVDDLNEEELRFVTHVAFYLDALSFSTSTPVVLEGVTKWKHELVLAYMGLLASREDLWHMLVLYASFLPEDVILERLPVLLQHIEGMNERTVIVQQMREYLPQSNLDLEVLRGIVALVLSESDEDDVVVEHEHEHHVAAPTRLDIRKMEAVLWLSVQREHADEALIATNTLLRQFFLSRHDKIPSAIMFSEDVLNDFLTNMVAIDEVAMVDTNMEMISDHEMQILCARLEAVAYLSFLQAVKSVQNWEEAMKETNHTFSDMQSISDDSIDKSKLNSIEFSIALKAERRKIIDTKRKTSRIIVTAAEAACTAMRKIFQHPGGWLLTDDEVVAPDDINGILRRKELDQLHSELLPRTVMMYHVVCVGTASWMSKSLDDAAEALVLSAKDAAQEIAESSSTNTQAVTSPIVPRFWTQKALQLAEMVENDIYKVRSAFCTTDYKLLLNQLAETAVSDRIYMYAQ
jgi:Nuclear pore protein 84 / 107